MKLEQLLRDQKVRLSMRKASVICLQTNNYPLLFCREFISYLSAIFKQPIIPRQMNSDTSTVMASLQTTFLGQPSWYWLHDDSSLSKKASDTWHLFLRSYEQPNVLIFCTTKAISNPPANWCVIQYPDFVDIFLFRYIAHMLKVKQRAFIDLIFKQVRTMPLDTAVLLCEYAKIIGKNGRQFVKDWLPYLVVPELSLFSLSQPLFARKPHQFFMQWKQLCDLYPIQFWLIFWSDQLWRASCYVRLQQQGKTVDAKKIGYRLPFSFLKNDWRLHSLKELNSMHAMLYEIDYHVKQGGSLHTIELLYASFFKVL